MSAEPRPDRNAQRSEATRGALVEAARGLFAERGYAGVGTEEVVRAAGVTRGALYHHFKGGKRDLFRAVVETIEREVVQEIAERAAGAGGPYAALELGADLWLEACLRPEVQQITLVDAPAVLGWAEWRRIDEEHALKLIVLGLEGAMEAGAMRRQPVLPLAHVMLGTMGEAGLRIANGEGTREEIEGALMSLLDGLRV